MNLINSARVLLAAGKTFLKSSKVLRAERAAGKNPEGVKATDDSVLDNAIQRLSGEQKEDSLSKHIFNSSVHFFVTPEHLDTPNVVNWLRDDDVKNDLKKAARMQSLGSVIPKEIYVRLQDRYSEVALAGPQEAVSIVLSAIAIIAEAIIARVEDSGTASLVGSSHRALTSQIQSVQDLLGDGSCLTLQKAEQIITIALDNNTAWLSEAFGNKKKARSAFGQALSPGDESIICTIDRKDLRIKVSDLIFGTPDDTVTALLGADGNGKSWIFAQAWAHQPGRPLTVIMVPDDINGQPSPEYCQDLLISKLLTQIKQIPTQNSRELWLKVLQHWQSLPDTITPRLVVLVDGVNQRESVDWIRFIDTMSEILAPVGGRLVLSCRRIFYRDRLESKLLSRVVSVEVPEWTDTELNELLSARGTSISLLDTEMVRTLRNPRIFGVAATLFNTEEIAAFGELSISRLLFEHIRSGSAAEGANVSDKQFKADICTHAENIVQRLKLQRNEDINEFNMPTLKAGGTSQSISEQFVITSAGRFFEVAEENPNKYLLKDEGLPLALGLTLVRTAREALRKNKSVEDALSNILEPISALDRTSDILMGAILAAVLEESPLEVISPLVRCFVMLQNIDSLHYPEFRSLFARNPKSFIASLEESSLSRNTVSNLSWLTRAVSELRGSEHFEKELSVSIHRWLSIYSLAPERMVFHSNTAGQAEEREKKLTEREQELSTIFMSLSDVERDLLNTMIRIDRGDYSRLNLLAFRELAGRPLAPYAESLRNWCLATSLNGGFRSQHDDFDDLLHFNLVDWEATRDALRASAKLLRHSEVSKVGKWALVYVLRATGESIDGEEGNSIADALIGDREHIAGWRRVEDYCTSDPCDPLSEQPDNIENTARQYKTLNPANLSQCRSFTLDDHFFLMAKPGLARFSPDSAIEVLRALADQALTRKETPFRLAAFSLEGHTVGLEGRVANLYVEKASKVAQAALDAGEDKNSEAWVAAQNSLLIAFPHMSGEEQFAAWLNHPADKDILRDLCDLLLPIDAKMLECSLAKAVEENSEIVQYRILTFAEHSATDLSIITKNIVIGLLKSTDDHVRLAVMSLIKSVSDPALFSGLVQSGWSASSLDEASQRLEILYGSQALVVAAEYGSISVEECLDRIAISAYESMADRLGSGAILEISERLNTAIFKAAEFKVTGNLPKIEQNIGGVYLPAVVEVSERKSQEDLFEQLTRFSETSEAWYKRQEHNRSVFDRFERELIMAGAQLIVRSINVRLILSIDKFLPAIIDNWCERFQKLDNERLNNVHNIACLVAETISKRNTRAGLALFERLEDASPNVLVTIGKSKLELNAVSIWRAAETLDVKKICFTRLDTAGNDHLLAMEVLAAIEAQREELLHEYVVDRRQRLEPAHRARAAMVAGFSPNEAWALETINLLKGECGFLHQAYIAAKYAMDRHQWSRHWAYKMRVATSSVELWRYMVLLSKIADGRFEYSEIYGDTPSVLVKRFGPTFNREIRSRISKWKNKRESKLFGMRAPSESVLLNRCMVGSPDLDVSLLP